MAAVTGTVNSVRLLDLASGPTFDSSTNLVHSAVIYVSFTGTYAQSDDGTIAAANTAIANARRDGKTVTIHSAALHSAGLEGTTAIGTYTTISHSSGTLTVQLSTGALTAEHANAALGTFNRDIGIYVSYVLS
jgi:hypothetical protein